MSTLERIYFNKFMQLGDTINYVECVIRFKDSGKLQQVIIAIGTADDKIGKNIFTRCELFDLIWMLTNVDIADMDTEDFDKFAEELNKYAESEEDAQYYFPSTKTNFDVVNIINLYNTL